jgi:hypothetical protein
VQLTVALAEPAHAHLTPAYPVCHGRGGTRPRVARDGRDRTPHVDDDHSPKQQGDVVLKLHDASVSFSCLKCFIGMLQVFYIDVAKVD